MGLFGSIGKVFGGALKVAGKVAGVASAIAPIPGLGAAAKLAGGIGGILNRGSKVQSQLKLIQSSSSGGQLKPGVVASLSPVMPGGAVLTSGVAVARAIAPGVVGGMYKTRPKKRRKRRVTQRQYRTRGRKRGRRRRGLSAAQLRAGFGGRRRMR